MRLPADELPPSDVMEDDEVAWPGRLKSGYTRAVGVFDAPPPVPVLPPVSSRWCDDDDVALLVFDEEVKARNCCWGLWGDPVG